MIMDLAVNIRVFKGIVTLIFNILLNQCCGSEIIIFRIQQKFFFRIRVLGLIF
jgi:hypothetical protein